MLKFLTTRLAQPGVVQLCSDLTRLECRVKPLRDGETSLLAAFDSYFANNRRLTGSGTGARLEYQDIDSSFLEMIRTKVSDQPIALEHDQTKRNYLHPVAGSEAVKIGAGLFLKPTV